MHAVHAARDLGALGAFPGEPSAQTRWEAQSVVPGQRHLPYHKDTHDHFPPSPHSHFASHPPSLQTLAAVAADGEAM